MIHILPMKNDSKDPDSTCVWREPKEEGGGVGLVRLRSSIRTKAQGRQHNLLMSYLEHCLIATQGIGNCIGESTFV